ncbi:energy-coupling factor ABC transporter ATP-binding protein [Obesumbacterium proteus]|uniref:energy-coupling factor ABC transporter ATP-binding protein n=1 Tax=Obesumbacterium proteus TaxID=82983 RepID=UPI001D106A47|nr:energy-coupling factor ABC transporter ATP-binding protein [Obesumbacterium proteus]
MALSLDIDRLMVDVHGVYPLGPITLKLEEGQWLAVLGGNGSGKSLLAKLLAGSLEDGSLRHIQGKCEVLGSNILLENEMKHTRQWVQQTPYLQFSGCCFTVEDEIAFGPQNLALPTAEIMMRVETALTRFKCQHLRLRNPQSLSGGEAQRVLLACVLVMHPKLLVLDQALGRLSQEATYQALDAIQCYVEELQCSVVMLEHRLFPAADYCLQRVLLDKGRTRAFEEILPSSLTQQVVLPEKLKTMLLQETANLNEAARVLAPFMRGSQLC